LLSIKKTSAAIVAAGVLTAGLSACLSSTAAGPTVTSRHHCRQDGKQAYCLTLSTGHVVFVSRSVWNSAQDGGGYSDDDGTVHVSHPGGAHDDPIEVHVDGDG
jgi:hypothetical protein